MIHEMPPLMTPPTADDWSQAEIVRALQRIEVKVDGLAAGYVPRTEWEIWADTRGVTWIAVGPRPAYPLY